jgi:hypothetical protein
MYQAHNIHPSASQCFKTVGLPLFEPQGGILANAVLQSMSLLCPSAQISKSSNLNAVGQLSVKEYNRFFVYMEHVDVF